MSIVLPLVRLVTLPLRENDFNFWNWRWNGTFETDATLLNSQEAITLQFSTKCLGKLWKLVCWRPRCISRRRSLLQCFVHNWKVLHRVGIIPTTQSRQRSRCIQPTWIVWLMVTLNIFHVGSGLIFYFELVYIYRRPLHYLNWIFTHACTYSPLDEAMKSLLEEGAREIHFLHMDSV